MQYVMQSAWNVLRQSIRYEDNQRQRGDAIRMERADLARYRLNPKTSITAYHYFKFKGKQRNTVLSHQKARE